MGVETVIEAGLEEEECGWKEDEAEAGRADREMVRESSCRVLTKPKWIVRRWAESDWRAAARSWKNAVSDRRGMIISWASSDVASPSITL